MKPRSLLSIITLASLLSMNASIAFAAAPSIVENLEAEAGDSEVTLTWDAATADSGISGYYVYAGTGSTRDEDGGFYSYGSVDVGDMTSYTYEQLSNDTTYYFAVTAYDESNTESEDYSNEVSAKPTAGDAADETAPTVSDVTAVTSTLLEVTFSEDVELPEDGSSAFTVESTDGTPLEVLDAYVSDDDDSVVLVVTKEQDPESEYLLTAGIEVTDAAGNPVESGTSDTAHFAGSSVAKADSTVSAAEDELSLELTDEDFLVEEIDVETENELLLTFSKDVENADAESFTIEEQADEDATVDVLAVNIDDEDATQVTLLIDDLTPGEDYVLKIDDDVKSDDGFSLSDEETSDREIEFTAPTKDLADLIAPEDITKFLASVVNESTAKLTWDASVDSAGDLANYLLYRSVDGGKTFSDPVTLAKSLMMTEVSGLTPGETYLFKVTAVDVNDNESEGVTATVTLPESGPGLLGLLGLSLVGAGVIRRRKQE